jgi:hypothetical protein
MAKTTVSRPLFEGTKNLGRFTHYGTTLEVHQCGTCGVVWAIDEEYLAARRNDHEGWTCPNGHSFVFNGPSEEERLRRQLESERDSRARLQARLDQSEASRRGLKGAATRARNEKARVIARIANGVCPCCNRTFENLARHMATKHAEYVDATDVEHAAEHAAEEAATPT